MRQEQWRQEYGVRGLGRPDRQTGRRAQMQRDVRLQLAVSRRYSEHGWMPTRVVLYTASSDQRERAAADGGMCHTVRGECFSWVGKHEDLLWRAHKGPRKGHRRVESLLTSQPPPCDEREESKRT